MTDWLAGLYADIIPHKHNKMLSIYYAYTQMAPGSRQQNPFVTVPEIRVI
eukprot:UN03783